ncbi:POTE ankyrin domain family member A, partial [Plecturocebus cupreus]
MGTALHLACASGNPEAVQCQEDECVLMLLEHGTDVNVPDVYGNTTLHYAVYNENKLMAKTLLLYGADIESANKSGLTPLLLGVHEQKERMCILMFNWYGERETALILAVRCGSAIIVSILLQQNIDVFSQDASGWTAEDYAVSGIVI